MTTENPRIALNNDVTIPQVGFGTFLIPPDDTQRAVEEALEMGYRHIDTAAAYYNEAGVGAALAATGLPRDEVFVTTKLRVADQGAVKAREAYDRSLEALGLDAADLYLIHWPSPARGLYVETWEALVDLQESGRVRAAGVSNFLPIHLLEIFDATGVDPTVNQIEVHPTFSQPELRRTCQERGIAVEAYSPLGHGADLADPAIAAIAQRVGLTPAQVMLRWHLQEGRIVIPKSMHAERMRENLEIPDVMLSDGDIAALDAMDRADGRQGGDPATFEFSQLEEDIDARDETR